MNKELLLTNTNNFYHIYCNNNLHIKINSIKYLYNKYNCTFILNNKMNICSNQSLCIFNLKSFSFIHNQYYIKKCRLIKIKYIQLNYSCVNDKFLLVNMLVKSNKTYSFLIYRKNTIIICICIIIFVSLFAFICSSIKYSSINKIQQEKYSTINNIKNIELNTQSIYDNQSKQEYELKILSLIESSSSSTLTSLNNKNSITNSSEYDNLTKDKYQSFKSQLPFKVKFNENYQLK
ncbi:unnamed protein product [Rotaria sp. Silwood2]|nr:unnamed protein product [Rotaria sp. Silwood2]CAF4323410.1 unnamed protein product [Rotaria sp. Silwood2]